MSHSSTFLFSNLPRTYGPDLVVFSTAMRSECWFSPWETLIYSAFLWSTSQSAFWDSCQPYWRGSSCASCFLLLVCGRTLPECSQSQLALRWPPGLIYRLAEWISSWRSNLKSEACVAVALVFPKRTYLRSNSYRCKVCFRLSYVWQQLLSRSALAT